MFTRSACATNDPCTTLASRGRVHDVAQIERRRRSALLVEATRTRQCQCSHVSTFFYYSVTRKQKMSGTKRTPRQAALAESKKKQSKSKCEEWIDERHEALEGLFEACLEALSLSEKKRSFTDFCLWAYDQAAPVLVVSDDEDEEEEEEEDDGEESEETETETEEEELDSDALESDDPSELDEESLSEDDEEDEDDEAEETQE
jgi:hypothetical protein